MAEFADLTFQRDLRSNPARVFAALIDPAARKVWGVPDEGSVLLIEGQPDPAEGLREIARVGPVDNPYVDVSTDWVVMEPGSRLIYAETLRAEGTVLGSSFAVVELTGTDGGCTLNLHVSIASFVGPELAGEIEAGWTHATQSLVTYLEGGAA